MRLFAKCLLSAALSVVASAGIACTGECPLDTDGDGVLKASEVEAQAEDSVELIEEIQSNPYGYIPCLFLDFEDDRGL